MKLSLSPLWLFAMGLVLVGMIGGVVFDASPERAVVHRAGKRVLEADLHTHTSWSDGTLSPLGIIRQANRRGLDVIAVTEHNTVLPSQLARTYAAWMSGPIALTGEEVTTSRFHVIALGIESTVAPERDLGHVIDAIHAQRGIAIAAHPVKRFWPDLVPMRDKFDGTEVMHPIAFGSPAEDWQWDDLVRFYDEAGVPLTAIGSSDYHAMSVLGVCRTLVFVEEPVTPERVLDALRSHATVTLDRQGVAHGNPGLVAALAREPYTPRTADYPYRGEGTGDRTSRLLGLLGVLGVVVLRARVRRREVAISVAVR